MQFAAAIETVIEKIKECKYDISRLDNDNAVLAILIGVADIDTKISTFLDEKPALYKAEDYVDFDGRRIAEKHDSEWDFYC